MVTLEALSVGTLAGDIKGKGRVISVYSGAVNIILPGGYLCSLLKNRSQMSDLGITVPDLFADDAHMALKDSDVIFSGGVLILSGSLRVVYDTAERWSGEVSPCRFSVPLEELVEVYKKSAASGGLSPVITGKNHNIYSRRALSVLDSSLGKYADLSPLIGLGIGFTPSGDDFITGVLLYADVFDCLDSKSSLVDRTAISDGVAKTTSGGRTLLSLALKHSYPFYLKEFISGLCEKNKDIDEIVISSLDHGATSGSDAVAGFIWAALRL